jgi:hypothetical protein
MQSKATTDKNGGFFDNIDPSRHSRRTYAVPHNTVRRSWRRRFDAMPLQPSAQACLYMIAPSHV